MARQQSHLDPILCMIVFARKGFMAQLEDPAVIVHCSPGVPITPRGLKLRMGAGWIVINFSCPSSAVLYCLVKMVVVRRDTQEHGVVRVPKGIIGRF